MHTPSQEQIGRYINDCRKRGGIDIESARRNQIIPPLFDPEVLKRIKTDSKEMK